MVKKFSMGGTCEGFRKSLSSVFWDVEERIEDNKKLFSK